MPGMSWTSKQKTKLKRFQKMPTFNFINQSIKVFFVTFFPSSYWQVNLNIIFFHLSPEDIGSNNKTLKQALANYNPQPLYWDTATVHLPVHRLWLPL